jgi:hypothetical protein
MTAAAISSSGAFFLGSARPEESRRARSFEFAAACVCRASQELSRSSINSTGRPSAFPWRAVQVQGKPDHDAANSLFADEFTQAPEVAAAVRPCPGRVRAGGDAVLVRKSEAKPLLSVINREGHTRNQWNCRQGRCAEGICHAPL